MAVGVPLVRVTTGSAGDRLVEDGPLLDPLYRTVITLFIVRGHGRRGRFAGQEFSPSGIPFVVVARSEEVLKDGYFLAGSL